MADILVGTSAGIVVGAVATDLNSGQPILFRRGNTDLAVRASSALPGVFQAVKIGNRQYVDGGLVAPVPVNYAKEMEADFVIAVSVSAAPEAEAASSSVDILLQTFTITGQSINKNDLKDADIVIHPELDAMNGNDFNARNIAILAGEQATMAQMPQIKKKLQEKRGD